MILLDASGSMKGAPAREAAQMGRDLADACNLLPNVKADVWGHSTEGSESVVQRCWTTGEPTKNVDRYLRFAMNGNDDGYAIAYIGEEMLKEGMNPRESHLIIVVSDGQPAYQVRYAGGTWTGGEHTKIVVDGLRRKGIKVVAIGIAHGSEAKALRQAQIEMYGLPNVAMHEEAPLATARTLAQTMGRAL
jgi:cobalamin biosynthesis protein CobT